MARSNSTRSGRRSQRTGQRLLGGIEMDHEIDEIGVAGRGERSGRNSDLLGARGRPGQRPDIGAGRAQPAAERAHRITQRGGLGAGLGPRPQSPRNASGGRSALAISGNRAEITMNDHDQEQPMQRTRRSGLSANQLMKDEDAFNRANEGGAMFEPDDEDTEMEGGNTGRSSGRSRSRSTSSSRSGSRSGSTARRAATSRGSRSSKAKRRSGSSNASRSRGSTAARSAGSSRSGSSRSGASRSGSRSGTTTRKKASKASGSRKKASRSAGASRSRGSTSARGASRAGGGRSRSASSTSRRSSGTGSSRSAGTRKASKRTASRSASSRRTGTARRTGGSRSSSRR